jgi:hypothetical protein
MKTLLRLYGNFIGLSFLFTGLSGCDSFVEVQLPKSQLTSVSVFENNATATAALTDIYAKIRDRGLLTGISTGLSNQLGNYTDELICYGNANNATYNFYNTILLASNSNISDYWNTTYNQIYAANAILEGTAKSVNLTDENKKLLQGEALFIRALLHFYLVNLYGDIPYITQTDYKTNSVVSRMPSDQVYEQLITDLEKARLLLPDTYTSTQRIRPNKLAVRALLARVYLYHGSFAEAANEASALINENSLYSLTEKMEEVFLLGSKETIWQLQSATAAQNTKEGATFIFVSGPPSLTSLTPALVHSFSATDKRKINWIKAVTKGTSTWYHAYKYKERTTSTASKEYSIVFRLAEQYLIRAEARAQQGDLIGAKEDLNKIRFRAGLLDTTAESKEELLTAILQERRWEFFTEYGHRFFDLKRFNQLDQALSGVKPGWNSTDRLFPIPQTELNANPKLRPQNSGY